jgi:calcium-dependent protein kinase
MQKKVCWNCKLFIIKPSYIAPEVIKKLYNYKCDIWSIGIILFVLISGNAPFLGKDN